MKGNYINVSSWTHVEGKSGFSFDPSFSAMLFPERSTNLVRGKGFHTNDQVLQAFVEAGDYQGALDYFGFEGTYNPNKRSKNISADAYYGCTNPITGDISYGDLAFTNYQTLLATYYKESYTMNNVRQGKGIHKIPSDFETGNGNLNTFLEEIDGYIYMYRHQGLYPRSSISYDAVNYYSLPFEFGGMKTNKYNTHLRFIYKIPRKW